ncbi:MAG: hypothetical protein GY953_39320 [bacterium]|nr:hypothetical protein [bacterium]
MRAPRNGVQPVSTPAGCFATWGYNTNDNITAVLDEHYFVNCTGMLRRGDRIVVMADMGSPAFTSTTLVVIGSDRNGVEVACVDAMKRNRVGKLAYTQMPAPRRSLRPERREERIEAIRSTSKVHALKSTKKPTRAEMDELLGWAVDGAELDIVLSEIASVIAAEKAEGELRDAMKAA